METSRAAGVRKRFIFSAATGLSLATVMGFPMSGWLIETRMAQEQADLTAMHLAIHGAHRAIARLNADPTAVEALEQGRRLPGLAGDRLYSDSPGGNYSVTAGFDGAGRTIEVTGTGIDTASGRTKRIAIRLKGSSGGLVQTDWKEERP